VPEDAPESNAPRKAMQSPSLVLSASTTGEDLR
jgi:hypothetical protein